MSNWTLTKPTEPGFYWVRSADASCRDISSNFVLNVWREDEVGTGNNVTPSGDALVCKGAHWREAEPIELTKFWWMPIPAPDDPPL